jgi:hypothetical protein
MISIGGTDHYKAFPRRTSKSIRNRANGVLNVTREKLQAELAKTDLSPDVDSLSPNDNPFLLIMWSNGRFGLEYIHSTFKGAL